MKVYQTNAFGYFVGVTTADADPLDEGWLIPAGCVLEEPPNTSVDQTARWDGSSWVVEAVAAEEPEDIPEGNLSERVRAERDQMLAESDWTQISDAPVDKEAWAVYRQELRDITLQSGFPDNVTFPDKPSFLATE